MTDISRREFFSKVCSKDSAKGLVGAWFGFKKELETNQEDTLNQLSRDETLIAFAQKLKKRAKTSRMKGGTKACI